MCRAARCRRVVDHLGRRSRALLGRLSFRSSAARCDQADDGVVIGVADLRWAHVGEGNNRLGLAYASLGDWRLPPAQRVGRRAAGASWTSPPTHPGWWRKAVAGGPHGARDWCARWRATVGGAGSFPFRSSKRMASEQHRATPWPRKLPVFFGLGKHVTGYAADHARRDRGSEDLGDLSRGRSGICRSAGETSTPHLHVGGAGSSCPAQPAFSSGRARLDLGLQPRGCVDQHQGGMRSWALIKLGRTRGMRVSTRTRARPAAGRRCVRFP